MHKRKAVNSLDLFVFSFQIGIKSLLAGKFTKEAVKRILCPMDPSRYYELPKVANSLLLKNGERVLDISSPKLLVYYLANKYPAVRFYGVDKYERELKNWGEIIKKPKNLDLLVEDATRLNFPKNYFDEIFSISVIEHVNDRNDRGDMAMVKSVYDVLKRNGRFLLTTVISNRFSKVFSDREIYSDNKTKKKTFFYRIYDYGKLKERILKVRPFKLLDEEICNYRLSFLETVYLSSPLLVPFGFLFLFLSPLIIYVTKSHTSIKRRAEYFSILVK